ncbi:hypothetical protein [Candidatus Chloroploca sp. Khr17]|uniref:hypothetical protein n=1 Tax=Candidatus Chloroploca sp. Khr17 TaxID=2496869 RepID=UPI00101C39A9|nr:hypothetical protein [Candidatus Chloroploca sp. Khr17]
MKSRSLHWLPVLLALVVLIAPMPALGAAQAEMLSLHARPLFGDVFRTATWFPVVVEVENRGADRTVQVQVGTRDGAQYAALLELPRDARKAVTLYAYMTPSSRRLFVRVLEDGRELATQPLQLMPANARAHVIGVVSDRDRSLRLPEHLPDGQPLLVMPVISADLPSHPLGLTMFHTLLLDEITATELRDDQQMALHEWVMRGGRLMIGGGDQLPGLLASLSASLRAAHVVEVRPLSAVTLVGASGVAVADVPFARLEPVADQAGRLSYRLPLTLPGIDDPIALEQTLGQGLLTVLAVPPGHPTLLAWDGWSFFWGELLRSASPLPPGFVPEQTSMDSFLESNMAASLTSLPALEFPPLGLLMVLVATYILLVGPGTFLLLRHLDRQALGWIVVPLLTLVFAGLTYGVGFSQRGNAVLFNQVTLIEPVAGSGGVARARSFLGIFSPRREQYTLPVQTVVSSRFRPLMRPISIQGPWDLAVPGGGIYYQDDRFSAVRDLAIAQWSMRALMTDTSIPLEGLQSRVMLHGERLEGEVTNNTPLILREVHLMQGNQVLRLGDLAPGATASGVLQVVQQDQMFGAGFVPVSYLIYGEELEQQGLPGGQPLSPDLQQRVRILDARFSYGPGQHQSEPLLVAWADTAAVRFGDEQLRVDRQELALITVVPRLEVSVTEVNLSEQWMQVQFEPSATNFCYGGQGNGLALMPQPQVLQLRLPRDLYGLRATVLTLLTSSDGGWPDGTNVALYDWVTGNWVAQPVGSSMRDRSFGVAQPERFLSSNGMVRVQVSNELPQVAFSCVYLGVSVRGALP